MNKIKLYRRRQCHLCELAYQLLYDAGMEQDMIEVIDIDSEVALVERFDLVIPVVEWENGQQLFWPFSLTDIQRVQQHSSIAGLS